MLQLPRFEVTVIICGANLLNINRLTAILSKNIFSSVLFIKENVLRAPLRLSFVFLSRESCPDGKDRGGGVAWEGWRNGSFWINIRELEMLKCKEKRWNNLTFKKWNSGVLFVKCFLSRTRFWTSWFWKLPFWVAKVELSHCKSCPFGAQKWHF